MRNIEIKASIRNLGEAKATAADLAVNGSWLLIDQVDTYYRVADGRLKLREKRGDEEGAELIYYRRPDIAGPRDSEYAIVPVEDPAGIKSVLGAALGIRTVVSKRRLAYLFENVRIHLDFVEGLGSFLEFEIMVTSASSEEKCRSLAGELMQVFGIRPDELIDRSYGDLLEEKGRGSSGA